MIHAKLSAIKAESVRTSKIVTESASLEHAIKLAVEKGLNEITVYSLTKEATEKLDEHGYKIFKHRANFNEWDYTIKW